MITRINFAFLKAYLQNVSDIGPFWELRSKETEIITLSSRSYSNTTTSTDIIPIFAFKTFKI